MPTNTTNYNLLKPIVGADTNDWGGFLNTNFDDLDAFLTLLFSQNYAATRPASVRPGGLWVDSDDNTIKFYNGTTDVPLARVTSAGQELLLALDGTDYIGRSGSLLSLFMNSAAVVRIEDAETTFLDGYSLAFGTDKDSTISHDNTDGFVINSDVDVSVETTEDLLLSGAASASLASNGNVNINADGNVNVTVAGTFNVNGDPVFAGPLPGFRFRQRVIYTTGSGTYTPPAGTIAIDVQCQGGGGAGGGVNKSANQAGFGGGGGGGGYCRSFLTGLASSYSYTVGAGGSGGTGTGGAGGNTTFVGGATNIVASGGSGGVGGNSSALGNPVYRSGGAGGSASGGDINLPGGRGQATQYGAYSPTSPSSTIFGHSGIGGGSMLGQGGANNATASSGNPGAGAGGGGSGADAADWSTSTNRNGGAGAPGIIIIDEYY